MRRYLIGTIAVFAAWLFSVLSYADLPSQMINGWDINLEPRCCTSRLFMAFILPTSYLLLPLAAVVLPRIDPKRQAGAMHEKTWVSLWNFLGLLLGSLQAVTVAEELEWPIDGGRVGVAIIGVALVVIGNSLGRVRPNWFLGIRTPWTLSNDEVWRKTHRLGAKTMFAGGFVIVVAALLPAGNVRAGLFIAGIVLAAAIPVLYSFVAWRRWGAGGDSVTPPPS